MSVQSWPAYHGRVLHMRAVSLISFAIWWRQPLACVGCPCQFSSNKSWAGLAVIPQTLFAFRGRRNYYKCLPKFRAIGLPVSTPTQSLKMGGAAPASYDLSMVRTRLSSLAAYGCLPRGTQMNIVSCHACHDRAHVMIEHMSIAATRE